MQESVIGTKFLNKLWIKYEFFFLQIFALPRGSSKHVVHNGMVQWTRLQQKWWVLGIIFLIKNKICTIFGPICSKIKIFIWSNLDQKFTIKIKNFYPKQKFLILDLFGPNFVDKVSFGPVHLDQFRTTTLYLNKNFFFPDPRTNKWFLIDGLGPLATIIAAYLYFCNYLGPRYMRDKKPYTLKNILIVYNLLQVLLSIYMFSEGLLAGWWNDYSFKCQPVDYSDNPKALRVSIYFWNAWEGKWWKCELWSNLISLELVSNRFWSVFKCKTNLFEVLFVKSRFKVCQKPKCAFSKVLVGELCCFSRSNRNNLFKFTKMTSFFGN